MDLMICLYCALPLPAGSTDVLLPPCPGPLALEQARRGDLMQTLALRSFLFPKSAAGRGEPAVNSLRKAVEFPELLVRDHPLLVDHIGHPVARRGDVVGARKCQESSLGRKKPQVGA